MQKYIVLLILLFSSILSTFGADVAYEYSLVMESFRSKDYNKTITDGLRVLDIAKSEQDYYHLAKLYFVLGYVSREIDDFGNAIIYYLEGSRMGLLSDDLSIKPSVISMHKNLESILTDYKHYDLAKKFIHDGIALSKEYDKPNQIIALTSNLIYIYLQEEKYSEALSSIDSLRNNFELDYDRLIQLKNKEGTAHLNLGNLKAAEDCYSYIVNNEPSSDNEMYALARHNLAYIELEKGNIEIAIDFLETAINYSIEEELSFRTFRGRQQLGQVRLELNQLDLALEQFLSAVDLIESSYTNNPETYSIYQWVSTTYEKLGNISLALKYKEIYSIKLEEYIAQQQEISELDKKYNIQLLTDRYYDLLAADMEQKRTEKLAKFGIGGTASFFLIILSVVVYRQKRMKVTLARELHELELHSEV